MLNVVNRSVPHNPPHEMASIISLIDSMFNCRGEWNYGVYEGPNGEIEGARYARSSPVLIVRIYPTRATIEIDEYLDGGHKWNKTGWNTTIYDLFDTKCFDEIRKRIQPYQLKATNDN